MRFSFYLALLVITRAISFFSVANAHTEVSNLQPYTESVTTMLKNTYEKLKSLYPWKNAANAADEVTAAGKKLETAEAEVELKLAEKAKATAADKKQETTTGKVEAVVGGEVTAADKKLESATTKLEAGLSNVAKVEGVSALGKKSVEATAVDKKVETAIGKIQARAELKPLNDANPKWKKPVSRFKNVDEAQAVKITEDVAAEVAKKPSKWSSIKNVLLYAYGVALIALIAAGLIAMAG